MKVEAMIFGILAVFFGITAPAYFFISHELAGSAALGLSFFLCFMVAIFLLSQGHFRKPDRPEDRKDGEIIEGAGELGFFPPKSIWPLFCAMTMSMIFLGPVFGWWLSLLGAGFGIFCLMGWLYEFYRGDYAH